MECLFVCACVWFGGGEGAIKYFYTIDIFCIRSRIKKPPSTSTERRLFAVPPNSLFIDPKFAAAAAPFRAQMSAWVEVCCCVGCRRWDLIDEVDRVR